MKPVIIVLKCQHCKELHDIEIPLIVTRFADKIFRFLCPYCKRKIFGELINGGLHEKKGYAGLTFC